MIRKFEINDLDTVMRIWLESNIQAHDFISKNYWKDNFEEVKKILPEAEVFVYEESGEVQGFVGLIGDFIAGIFVANDKQSKGIGRELLMNVKDKHNTLSLKVYKKNERAIKFYLREGFTVEKEETDEKTGEIEYLMEWSK